MNVSDNDIPMLEPPSPHNSSGPEEDAEPQLEPTNDPVSTVDLTTQPTQPAIKPPSQPKSVETVASNLEEDEGDTCPICLDMWADAGAHRLCAMKCGHLFGRNCIETWLKDNRTCPSCKKRGLKRDLRNLYCNKVIALEESAVTALKARLYQAELNETLLETTLNQYIVQRDQLISEVDSLRKRLKTQESNSIPTALFHRIIKHKSVQISAEAGCRVLDYDTWLNAIVCSMKCPTGLFGNYGLAKLSMSTFEVIGNIPLHSAPIRDVKFQSEGGSSLLATVSMDKQAKLVDTRVAGAARTYNGAAPLWSCCWGDAAAMGGGGAYALYVGEQQGDVVELDVRRLTDKVNTLKVEGDMSPVVSITTLPPSALASCLRMGAIVACKLSSVRIFERSANAAYNLRNVTNVQGPFICLSSGARGSGAARVGDKRQLLLSGRPNAQYAWTRHMYGEFREETDGELSFAPVHTFGGGASASILSRSCVTAQYACAYVGGAHTVALWSLSSGLPLFNQAVQQPVCDVASFCALDGTSYVMMLDERRLDVFRLEQ